VLRIVEGHPKTRKMLFLDLDPPTLQNFRTFHDSTRPHLHLDGLPPKSRQYVLSIWEYVTNITKKNSCYGLAWSRPRADRGLSRPKSVFCTTIDVCKIYPDSRSVEIWLYEVQKPVSVYKKLKQRTGKPSIMMTSYGHIQERPLAGAKAGGIIY